MIQSIIDWFMAFPRFIKEVRSLNKKTGGITKWNVMATFVLWIAGAILLYTHVFTWGMGCLFAGMVALIMNREIAGTIIRYFIVGTLSFITALPLSFLTSLTGFGEFRFGLNTLNVIFTGVVFAAVYFLRRDWLED